MAEKQNLDSLNEKRLGDGKLSKEELSYIQSQEQLWYKNIGDKLFQDIIDTNTTILSQDKVLGSFVDEILNDSLLMKQIVAKSGLKAPGIDKQLASKNPTEKYYMLVNILLHGCNAMSEVQGNLVTNINKPAITGATIKSLHRFQKQGEKVNGRSKADCLIGKKTIQQMLAKIGVQTKQNKVDSNFASSNITAKEKYDYNGQQQKQMDIIINDPILSDVEKTQKLIEVAKNTVEKGTDGLDKKYGAVSYMMTRVSDKIMRDKSPEEIQIIIDTLQSDPQAVGLIKKYWNENSAKQFGVNPNIVKKTSDWANDLKERKETLANNRENIKAMISAYRGYLDTLSQDYKGLDWATDIDENLQVHIKKIDKLLYNIDNTTLYNDDAVLAKALVSIMNDPHSQRIIDSEYAKVFIKNKTKGSEQYEYYLAHNDMKKLISNPGGWGDKGKEKFVQLLRSMDNNDDSTLLVNSYESTDGTKDITKDAVDKSMANNKETKEQFNQMNKLFTPDKYGHYPQAFQTLVGYIDSGEEDNARIFVTQQIQKLSTDDHWYPNFVGGNDYIDDLMDNVKSLNEKEKETKKDIKSGLEEELKKLEQMENNGTLNQNGATQLERLRAMSKNGSTLDTMVQESYKQMKYAMISNSIGHELRSQMLDQYPGLFKKGSGSLVDSYANVVGAGDYFSDSTVESIQSTTVQVLIQVILAICSFGAANAIQAAVTASVSRVIGTQAASALAKNLIYRGAMLGVKGLAYTATTAAGNAVMQAKDVNQIGEIFSNGMSINNIIANTAMIGILSRFKALSEIGKLKNGAQATKTIKDFVTSKLANKTTRVVTEEIAINLTQGGSKLIFGDGKFTTEDFIEATAQGLAFEMIPGMGDINVFKSGKDLMMKTIVNGKIYTGTIDQVLSKLEIDHPGTKSLVQNNAKQKGVDKLVFNNQKKSLPNTKKASMPRERARDQLPPKSSEKIAALKHNNEVKKIELENNIKNLEKEKQQLLKQRQEVISSLDQANKPKDYKNLNNALSNLKTQKLLLESEVTQMKTNPNNPAKNAYFMEHAKELVGKNIWIDGKTYSVSHINTNGSLEIKLKDGAERISLSSFSELQQKGQVNGFSDTGGTSLKKAESENHALLQQLFSGEKEYMTTRANDLITKQQKLTEMNTQIRSMEEQLVGAKSFQNKIDDRATKLADINKKIRANEVSHTKAWEDYLETDRLDAKYNADLTQAKANPDTSLLSEMTANKLQEIKNKYNIQIVKKINGFHLQRDGQTFSIFDTLEQAEKKLEDRLNILVDMTITKPINLGENVSVNGITIDGNTFSVLNVAERMITIVEIDGTQIPFYLTTGQGGKDLEPGWYPMFGYSPSGWLNKTNADDMNLYYERLLGKDVSDVLRNTAKKLNQQFGTNPNAIIQTGIISSEKVYSAVNSVLKFIPAENAKIDSSVDFSQELGKLENNIRSIGSELNNKINIKVQLKGYKTSPIESIGDAKTPKQKIESLFYEAQMDKAASGIADNIFGNVPTTSSDAMSKLEQFGFWLGKTTVGPTLKFLDDAMKWLRSIELKFPDIKLKEKIDSVKKSLRDISIKRHIQIIDSYSRKSLDDKISLWDANNTKDLSLDELQAFHKLFTGEKANTTDRAKVGDYDAFVKNRIKDKIKYSINDQKIELSNSKIINNNELYLDHGGGEVDVIPLIEENIIDFHKNDKILPNKLYKGGVDQAIDYNNNSESGRYTNKIIDGFTDGGRSAKIFDSLESADEYAHKLNYQDLGDGMSIQKKGQKLAEISQLPDGRFGVSNREFLIVDRINDIYLNNFFSSAKNKIDKIPSTEGKFKEIAKLVYEFTNRTNIDQVGLSDTLRGSMYLGDIIKEGLAVCRHRSLLFHMLAGECGLDSAIRKGQVSSPTISGGHAWNEINIDGKWKLMDVTYIQNGNPQAIFDYKDVPSYGVLKNGEFKSFKQVESKLQEDDQTNDTSEILNINIPAHELNDVSDHKNVIIQGKNQEIPIISVSDDIPDGKSIHIIEGEDYEPNDVQSINVDIEDIANSDYGNQLQQNDYRNKKQQEEDEFLNDVIINNAGADMFRGMDE